ncbi:MAG: hypothetical protein WCT31_03320 [Candidatus Micrarchaeia archaeon]
MSSLKFRELFKGERVYLFMASNSNVIASTFRYKEEWHALSREEKWDAMAVRIGKRPNRLGPGPSPSEAEVRAAIEIMGARVRMFSYLPENEPIMLADEPRQQPEVHGIQWNSQIFLDILGRLPELANASIFYQGLLQYGMRGENSIGKILGFDSLGKAWVASVPSDAGIFYRFDPAPHLLLGPYKDDGFRALGFIDATKVLLGTTNLNDPGGVMSNASELWLFNSLDSSTRTVLSGKEEIFKILNVSQNNFLLYTSKGLFTLTLDGNEPEMKRITGHPLLNDIYKSEMGVHYDFATDQIWVYGGNFIGFNDGDWHLTRFEPGTEQKKWAFGTAFGKAYFIITPDIDVDFTRTFETNFVALVDAVKRGNLIAPF